MGGFDLAKDEEEDMQGKSNEPPAVGVEAEPGEKGERMVEAAAMAGGETVVSLEEVLEAHAPKGLICPISLQLFNDPVLLVADGCTYTHAHIEQHLAWCCDHGKPFTSPNTNLEIDTALAILAPNVTVRGCCFCGGVGHHSHRLVAADAVDSQVGNRVEVGGAREPNADRARDAVALAAHVGHLPAEAPLVCPLLSVHAAAVPHDGVPGVPRRHLGVRPLVGVGSCSWPWLVVVRSG